MVLDEPAAQDNHASPLGADGHGVDAADILDEVDLELQGGRLESVEIQHVAQAAVSDGRAENWDVILIGPVVDRTLVVDLLAEAMDDLGGRPVDLLIGTLAGLLLLQHFVEDGHDPVLKGAVVGVGDDQVTDAVEALAAEVGTGRAERADVGVAETLDEILLDAAGGCHDGRDVVVLDEPAEDAAQAG